MHVYSTRNLQLVSWRGFNFILIKTMRLDGIVAAVSLCLFLCVDEMQQRTCNIFSLFSPPSAFRG